MNLDPAQKEAVATWINQGLKLSDIQTRLGTEFGLKLSYMEVRFLVADLQLVPTDPPPRVEAEKDLAKAVGQPPAKAPTTPTPARSTPSPATPQAPEPPPATSPGRVTLAVDQLTRPGCLASGQVTFSDGQLGDWYFDQMGRLGVAPRQKGYRPSAQDVEEFQMALESQLARLGM